MNKDRKICINLIKSFFIAFACMSTGSLESTSILVICAFAFSMILLSYKNKIIGESDRKALILSYITGGLFAVLYALFKDVTGGLENPAFKSIFAISTIIGLFLIFSELILFILVKAEGAVIKTEKNPFSLKLLLIYSGIVFICCLPFLALNYPGVMTPDSLSQYSQINGLEPYVNHHPWVHTAIFGLFYKLGFLCTGNTYTAIAFYTFFQIIIVSLSIGYSIECMYEFGFGRCIHILLLLSFILLPYNLIYSVTIWKDILFSMAVLILTMTLLRCINEFTVRDIILFNISGIMMCLLRHNGFYAFVATALILLLFKRNTYPGKAFTKLLISSASIVIVALLLRGPVPDALGIERDEFVYNLPIPLQQIGAVVVNDCELTSDQEDFLRSINSLEYIKAGYSRQGADSMSAWVLSGDTDFFNSHKGDFFKLWVNLGIKHPILYIRSYLDITMGYWAPMQPQQTVFFGITEYDTGLHTQALIQGPLLIKINELLYKFYTILPVYGFMYCMGGFFWLLLIAIAVCLVKSDASGTHNILCMVPVLMLTLTLFIATPLAADLRYSYALMITLPYLIINIFRKK